MQLPLAAERNNVMTLSFRVSGDVYEGEWSRDKAQGQGCPMELCTPGSGVTTSRMVKGAASVMSRIVRCPEEACPH
eukprot:5972244-Amphidinium_carterae.3